jgi:hypothetical protein
MPKKNTQDVLDILTQLQQHVLAKKPSHETMWEEVRMMKFKVRPLYGDISFLNVKNEKLIETMWSLGKLDEFFQKEYGKLPKDQKEVFSRMIDNLYATLQTQLNGIQLKDEASPNVPQLMEMEIFREAPQRKLN